MAPPGQDPPESWAYLVEAIDGALLHDDVDTAAAAASAFGADRNGWHWSGLRTVPTAPVQRLHDVLGRIPPSDGARRARILAKSAVGLYGDPDLVPSEELSAEAVEIARRIGDRRLPNVPSRTRGVSPGMPGWCGRKRRRTSSRA